VTATNQRPNICGAGSTIPGCAGQPAGTLVTTNVASISGSNYAVSSPGIAACNAAGVLGCPTTATTFVAPANASGFGPVDSIDGKTPVDFQFISGDLGRNAGQSVPLYRFDLSLGKAFAIPKWETTNLELKLEVFNVFNRPLFILNNGNDEFAPAGEYRTETKQTQLTIRTTAGAERSPKLFAAWKISD
jgi:hypothetical protein